MLGNEAKSRKEAMDSKGQTVPRMTQLTTTPQDQYLCAHFTGEGTEAQIG